MTIEPPHARRVIGFAGRIGAGKSVAAEILRNYNFQRVRFAGPLKAMAKALGLTDEQIDGSLKETPTHLLCDKTPRWAMQTLGTEWGRDLIGMDIWTNAWKFATEQLPEGVGVVADDVRYANEAVTIRELGGIVVRIVRPGVIMETHTSEAGLFPCEITINNNGDLTKLASELRTKLGLEPSQQIAA